MCPLEGSTPIHSISVILVPQVVQVTQSINKYMFLHGHNILMHSIYVCVFLDTMNIYNPDEKPFVLSLSLSLSLRFLRCDVNSLYILANILQIMIIKESVMSSYNI